MRNKAHTIICALFVAACATPRASKASIVIENTPQRVERHEPVSEVEEYAAYFVLAIEHMAESYDVEYEELVWSLVQRKALVIDQDGMLQLGPALISEDTMCKVTQ